MATDLTSRVLDALSQSDGPIRSSDAFLSIPSSVVKSALDRLGSREMVSYKAIDREEAVLTAEAEGIAADGSHEAKVFEAVRKAVEGLKIVDLPVRWLNCTPARLDTIWLWWADCGARKLWERKAQRLDRARLSKRDGLGKRKTRSKPT